MDTTVAWIILVPLILISLIVLVWTLNIGATTRAVWRVRKKLSGVGGSLDPRMNDESREFTEEFTWQGPGTDQQQDRQELEGSDEEKGQF